MTRRDLRWRLAGAILLAAAGGSSLLNRHVAAGAGQPAPIETVLGLASFLLASLGILLLINGPRLRDKWRDECADVDRSAPYIRSRGSRRRSSPHR